MESAYYFLRHMECAYYFLGSADQAHALKVREEWDGGIPIMRPENEDRSADHEMLGDRGFVPGAGVCGLA